MKKTLILLVVLITFKAQSQIVIDNLAPYNTPVYLIDNVLLGGGVIASNHTFQGEPSQIGWFNAINTNLGIDSGIVMCTGDIYALDPINGGGFPFLPNTVTDPDLLAVANSVPGMIGQSFSVSSINDVAVLEFDFIPTSDSMEFRYAFGSQEYFGWENTQYNDVFGFFLSGPGIAGPWANGAINLAVVPNTNPPLPITISSVCNNPPAVMNPQYFVNNQALVSIADADGLTTVLTAQALVQCGATYHIKLAIADGSDGGLSSYVWLEAGSFYSPTLNIVDDLGIDSAYMSIPCNSTITLTANGGVGATYHWFDSTSTVFSTASTVNVGEGTYVVSADISGCAVFSDTLIVEEGDFPTFSFGPDLMIACNSDTLIDPVVSGGTAPYTYLWNSGQSDSMLTLAMGNYQLTVTDLYGCLGSDTLEIIYDPPPVVDLGVDYNIPCNTNTTLLPNIIGGTQPYSYLWNNGLTVSSIDIDQGNFILTVTDFYGCSDSDTLNIIEDPIPQATISGGGSVCDDGSTAAINFTFNGLLPWDLTYTNGSVSSTSNDITSSNYSISTSIAGNYGIVLADDVNDCIASDSGIANVIVNPLPIAVITPNDITIYFGEEVDLTTGTYVFYEWYTEFDSLISIEQILTVQDSGRYKVWIEDGNGCTDMSELAIVRSVPLTQLFIPLAFTPNDDEHNELFVIKGLYIQTFNIKIFDRWGNQLFESDAIDKYWDGTFENKKVQQGTYYYHIEVLGLDSKLFKKSGNIQVLY